MKSVMSVARGVRARVPLVVHLRGGILALGVLSLSSFSSVAYGADAADEALAETLYTSGKALMSEKRWDEACTKFDSARKLSPGIGVTMWLADCHEQAGRLASAWLYFRDAAANARSRGDGRASLAEARARKLEPKLPRVRVIAQGYRGEIFRDGVKLPDGALGEATPIDFGTYRYRFVDDERVARELVVTVSEESRTYDISPEEASPVSTPPDATDATTAPSNPEPDVPVVAPPKRRTLGYVFMGLALVGGGLGAGFGVDALGKRDRSNDGHCTGNLCDAEGVSLRDRALASATISTVSFAVAAVALAAGSAIFLGVFDRSPSASARAYVPRSSAGFAW